MSSVSDAEDRPIAVVTGASSGIGAATARELARSGYRVLLGARRAEKIEAVAAEIGGLARPLDVTSAESVSNFISWAGAACGRVDALVNSAGLALGRETVDSLDDEDLVRMWETNVLGLLRMTRGLLPLIRRAPLGNIVNIGSVAGFDNYRGGAGYTATKHAVRAITQTLRLELNGEPIRVTEIAPGMLESDFSRVRFKGDAAQAAAVYEGVVPLQPEDIAACVAFVLAQPAHVNVDYMVVRPLAQAASWMVARKS